MNLFIESTIKTPEVKITEGRIQIKGRSIPEDSFVFYVPVLENLTKYFKDPPPETKVDLYLEYINSASKKMLINILDLLEKSFQKGVNIIVNWKYEEDDEDIYDMGLDLKGFYKMPIKMVEII